MTFRSYGIVEDTEKGALVMGVKSDGYLEGFLVFFGGRVEESESTKEALAREVKEETEGRVTLSLDDTRRFESFFVSEPGPAMLFFFRCTNSVYTVGKLWKGGELSAVVAVSIDKLLTQLPDDPAEVSAEKVANALITVYGGGADVKAYRESGTVRALRDYLVTYHYDAVKVSETQPLATAL